MDKDKLNELETLLDGLEYDLDDLLEIHMKINWKVREAKKLLTNKEQNDADN